MLMKKSCGAPRAFLRQEATFCEIACRLTDSIHPFARFSRFHPSNSIDQRGKEREKEEEKKKREKKGKKEIRKDETREQNEHLSTMSRMNISSGRSVFFFERLSLAEGRRRRKINYSSRIGREKVVIIRGKYKLNTRREREREREGGVYSPPPPSLLVFRSPAGASPPSVGGALAVGLRPSFL